MNSALLVTLSGEEERARPLLPLNPTGRLFDFIHTQREALLLLLLLLCLLFLLRPSPLSSLVSLLLLLLSRRCRPAPAGISAPHRKGMI